MNEGGATVEKDPSGWELGVHTINISSDFARNFSAILGSRSRTLDLQFLHGDHVKLERGLPSDMYVIGSTSHCQNQGIHQPGRVLTLQGQPEFDQFITTEALKLVGGHVGWDPEFIERAIQAAAVTDDAGLAADIIVWFLWGLDLE